MRSKASYSSFKLFRYTRWRLQCVTTLTSIRFYIRKAFFWTWTGAKLFVATSALLWAVGPWSRFFIDCFTVISFASSATIIFLLEVRFRVFISVANWVTITGRFCDRILVEKCFRWAVQKKVVTKRKRNVDRIISTATFIKELPEIPTLTALVHRVVPSMTVMLLLNLNLISKFENV